MRFTIYRITGYDSMKVPTDNEWEFKMHDTSIFTNYPPCKNAILVTETIFSEPIPYFVFGAETCTISHNVKTFKKYHWEVEINTIEDLIKLVDEVNCDINFTDKTIRINDGI